MDEILSQYRDELSVAAPPSEMTGATQRAMEFLQTQAARVSPGNVEVSNAVVLVENLTGHKLPTAYPARRAWLHFVCATATAGRVRVRQVRADGSIVANDNDYDQLQYDPTTAGSNAAKKCRSTSPS
jgi:hypothetical protein